MKRGGKKKSNGGGVRGERERGAGGVCVLEKDEAQNSTRAIPFSNKQLGQSSDCPRPLDLPKPVFLQVSTI